MTTLSHDDGRVIESPDESPIIDPTEVLAGVDVTTLVAGLIQPAVKKAVAKQVDLIAAKAAAAALTPELIEQLHHNASQAAQELVDGAEADAHAAPTTKPADDEEPELCFASVDKFVEGYLRFVYARKIDGRSTFWSREWWRSSEAQARLEAIWRAWEHLRLDASTGQSVWWRDHADPHMRILMSEEGPFSKEIDTKSTIREPLPCDPAPPGLFPDQRPKTKPAA